MNIRCPWCQASIGEELTRQGKCPECGGVIQATNRARIKLPVPPASGGPVRIDIPASAPEEPTAPVPLLPVARPRVASRRARLDALRGDSAWSGTRRYFGALACIGCTIGALSIAGGFIGLFASPALGLSVLAYGIAMVLGSISTCMLVTLLADIADLLLGPGE